MIFIIVCLVAYVLIVVSAFVVVRKFKKRFIALQAEYNETLSILEDLTADKKEETKVDIKEVNND